MEVTEKTRADMGSTLAEYEGELRLVDPQGNHDLQVPVDYQRDFRSSKRFRHFNTNNLWVDLRAVQRLVAQDKLQMEVGR
jgi:UTP--glucose-1-phosphate uridylyltransferase